VRCRRYRAIRSQILAAFAKPVAAPSAKRSGRVSPTTAQHVLHDLRDRIDVLSNDGQDWPGKLVATGTMA
jgi:L-threonylcarbamoyladenylate synthase